MIVQWGNITLYIDNAYFFKDFQQGTELYARDCMLVPNRRISMSITDVLRYVAVPDEIGHYHFNKQAQEHIEEYLGVFLGYLSGPLPIQPKP
jgi:hypothetical protein